MIDAATSCPLCGSLKLEDFYRDKLRPYLRCLTCELVFVPADHYLSAEQERKQYDLHRNDPADQNYRRFLAPVFSAVRERVATPAQGLDYGSGPGPTLSVMLQESGYEMSIYDIFYADDRAVLDRPYHFITCTEVVEHLHHPGEVLSQLFGLLAPGGWLTIMTKRYTGKEAFAQWHYKNDPTHVCFYSDATFAFVADQFNTKLEVKSKDLVLLQKRVDP